MSRLSSRIGVDRPATQYKPEFDAGWEYRLVMTTCGGRQRVLLCEVLWAQGAVVVARPVRMPHSSACDLWESSWQDVLGAAETARKRPPLLVEGGLVAWDRE